MGKNTVIKIEDVSKMYDLGLVGTGTLSKDLNRAWARLRGKPDPYATLAELNVRSEKSKSNTVWALKDISLEVEQGEVLGIIGKNGAGKSTLLKILSRITTPTTGTIKMKGRVGSLLEVGTGMHPEMTARQNIFLNGAIMGMTRAEVKRKLDEIVDFAGIGKYIDTPIKRFSSGMKVRLGFAVAAFLEPEILIVDEVLAVGDAEFQKKAIGKMQDVSTNDGRTVLFVSHNMESVSDLCQSAIILKNGTISNFGTTSEMIDLYLKNEQDVPIKQYWSKVSVAPGNNDIKIKEIKLIDRSKTPINYSQPNIDTGVLINFEVLRPIANFNLGINLHNMKGIHVFSTHDNNKFDSRVEISTGIYQSLFWIPKDLMQGGDYLLDIAAMRYNPFIVLFNLKEILKISYIDTANSSTRPEDCNRQLPGVVRPKINWEKRKKI